MYGQHALSDFDISFALSEKFSAEPEQSIQTTTGTNCVMLAANRESDMVHSEPSPVELEAFLMATRFSSGSLALKEHHPSVHSQSGTYEPQQGAPSRNPFGVKR